jgi:hypothetical protein
VRWPDEPVAEGCQAMIYLDGHVHLYNNFSLAALLDHALANLTGQGRGAAHLAPSCLLLLSEGKGYDRFAALRRQLETGAAELPGGWRLAATAEAESLWLQRPDQEGAPLFFIAGRQIITAERIEVLALGSAAPFADGRPLAETVAAVRQRGALAVLPWGFGKWLGSRGELVRRFLAVVEPQGVFVGDSGGRPRLWPRPAAFAAAAGRGIRLLPGSDPLPLAGEERRVGRYGAAIAGNCRAASPAADLKRLLLAEGTGVEVFGRRQGVLASCLSQLALRLRR